MYNSDTPLRTELPSSKQLLRSTILAIISALVILVVAVLPAEYGIDPTGIGRMLRLTEMGNIKQQLAKDASADATAVPAALVQSTGISSGMAAAKAEQPTVALAVGTVPEVEWRDEMPFMLKPGEGMEIKLKMTKGVKAHYSWVVQGGEVNFDTHGDAPGEAISYEKGRGVSSKVGVLEAAFTGNHGWYWRNRGQSQVQVILRTRGDYTDIKKM
jgi:hypothetical protein